jgi:hypothetical protein
MYVASLVLMKHDTVSSYSCFHVNKRIISENPCLEVSQQFQAMYIYTYTMPETFTAFASFYCIMSNELNYCSKILN